MQAAEVAGILGIEMRLLLAAPTGTRVCKCVCVYLCVCVCVFTCVCVHVCVCECASMIVCVQCICFCMNMLFPLN
jgi:hypothetical protein